MLAMAMPTSPLMKNGPSATCRAKARPVSIVRIASSGLPSAISTRAFRASRKPQTPIPWASGRRIMMTCSLCSGTV